METNPSDPSQPPSADACPNPASSRPAVVAGSPAMLPSNEVAPNADPLHRRTRSEFVLRIPEDFDLSFGEPMATSSFEEIGSEDDFFSTFMDIEKIGCKLEGSGSGTEDGAGLDRLAESSSGAQERVAGNAGDGGAAPTASRGKHRYSNSADGSSASSVVVAKGEAAFGEILETKKAMTAEQLLELTSTDPKRAKRFVQFCSSFCCDGFI